MSQITLSQDKKLAQPKLHICDMQANDVADALKSWLAMKSGGSHRDNHHFQWTIAQKERTARNTPDSFCRRFTRQNHRLRCVGGIFLYGKRTLKIS
ncbi:MAG: hypothetical protein ACLTSA_01140 [Faecalibacterium sp.]